MAMMFTYFNLTTGNAQVKSECAVVTQTSLDTSLTNRAQIMNQYQELMDRYVAYSGMIPLPGMTQDSIIKLLSTSVFSPGCKIFDELIPLRVRMSDGIWYKTRFYTFSKLWSVYLEDIRINFPKGISRVIENGNWKFKDWTSGKVSVLISRTSTAIDTGGYQFTTNDTAEIQMQCKPPALQARIVAIRQFKSRAKTENSPLPLLRVMNMKDLDFDGILNENDPEPTIFNKKK